MEPGLLGSGRGLHREKEELNRKQDFFCWGQRRGSKVGASSSDHVGVSRPSLMHSCIGLTLQRSLVLHQISAVAALKFLIVFL